MIFTDSINKTQCPSGCMYVCCGIALVQMTVHVSVSGLPVLTIFYKLILMHKRTKSQILCLIQVEAWKKAIFFYIFLTFGQFHQKSGFIGWKQN